MRKTDYGNNGYIFIMGSKVNNGSSIKSLKLIKTLRKLAGKGWQDGQVLTAKVRVHKLKFMLMTLAAGVYYIWQERKPVNLPIKKQKS